MSVIGEQALGLVRLLSILLLVGFIVHETRSCQMVSPIESIDCERVCSTSVKTSTPFECECWPEKNECDETRLDLASNRAELRTVLADLRECRTIHTVESIPMSGESENE